MSSSRLWSPSAKMIEESNLAHYMRWLKTEKDLTFADYDALWRWSTEDIAGFWKTLWDYFGILSEGVLAQVVSVDSMPGVRWFEGVRLNYAENVFSRYNDTFPAIIHKTETQPAEEISWAALRQKVAGLQHFLLECGVTEGDCVAAFLPCIPEATIAFLATNSIGATWSSCSPDFGSQSVIDRLAQTRPKILIVSTHYSYGGKSFSKQEVIEEVAKSLPGLAKVIVVGQNEWWWEKALSGRAVSWSEATRNTAASLTFHRVPFQHPIWILYSSGTTGLPKAITHSQGGILMEHLKYLTFHNNVKLGERFFWYTTTGWMMWNYLQSSLLCGATMVLYDGSPAYPDLNVLWKLAQDHRLNHFGTSASYLLANKKAGNHPGTDFDLTSLQSIGSTGSTLPPEGFEWVYENVKKDLWLASMSGGTDVCSAFVGGNPTLPVYSGEIQCRALGASVEAFSEEGLPLLDAVGEMVITKPMPSMPVYFWNDPAFKRYKESYFETYPSVWRHGDWIKITPNNGVIIYGRSDATLNRGGVRIGTSEIYRAIDKIKEIKDSLMVCIERDRGEFYMPLFVEMQEGQDLTDAVRNRINRTLREDYSPRHVPDQIIAVPGIPYTLSGKKTEAPVKNILMGKDLSKVASTGSLRNPESLDFFIDLYKTLSQQ